ncbi:MAG: hypothetical protein FWD82_02145 [Defluviitaleaceae bacterium]|nr:hypothetical protein [Defluviitaleaceae bacterium]
MIYIKYCEKAKKAYIDAQVELFAYELFLTDKYLKKETKDLKILLNSFLNKGWILSNNEQKLLLQEAIKLANEKYFKNKV